jgi:hypothetical protein
MAYTSGVFYIDLVSGSDTARTALTTCIASNPSGTITRINKTAHGLVTGAVVDLTLFSAWLNGAWKITKVDNDNFDLDTAVWQTTADANGTVTPRGGSSWSDAWLTMTTGASATRVQSGDEVRVSKTDDPVSIGNATWTDLSKTVTLATAQTLTIDNCETAWTVANTSTITASTIRKQGSNSVRVIKSTAPATNTLYGYKALGSAINFSAYDSITLWVNAYSSSPILANNWKLALCSDTAGATIQFEYPIPASAAVSAPYPVTITGVSVGGNKSAIQSIALYSSTVAPLTTCGISLDNISASNATGLNLTTVISKISSAGYDSESWWPIQSIDGTTVLLDTGHEGATSTKGYTGTTGTVTSYFRRTFAQGPYISNAVANTLRAGVIYGGGWDTSSSTQTGMTALDARTLVGQLMLMASGTSIERLCLIRGDTGISFVDGQRYYIDSCNIVGNYYPIRSQNAAFSSDPYGVEVTNCSINSYSITVFDSRGGGHTFDNVHIKSTGIGALQLPPLSIFKNGSILNATNQSLVATLETRRYLAVNSTFDVTVQSTARSTYFKNCLFTAATEFAFSVVANGRDGRVFSEKHDQTNYDYIFIEGGTANTEDTDRSGATGKMWRLVLTSSNRNGTYPLDLPVAQFPYASSGLVTVTAWMKKSHATNCNGRLRIKGGQITGYSSNLTATLADNTNWQQLTITFTPTDAGVFEVEALAEYVTANANVYIDNITVSQA